MKKLLIRWTNWEYWPFSVLYLPVFLYFGWLALKHRSLFFFTASNPSIKFGGMFGESKSEIFKLIPEKYLPKTELIERGNVEKASWVSDQIGLPIIAKPDVGERGKWVKKLNTPEEVCAYAQSCPVDFLLQEMIELPIELGVFFIKYPGEKEGRVTSIVRKDFLKVEGDGKSTVRELLAQNERAALTGNLNITKLRDMHGYVPSQGEEVLVEPIGNHCRGTKFLNDQHEIDHQLHKAFNTLANQIDGFYFGRFDLKCQTYDQLRQLNDFKIMELNGAGAEPAHIYQPGYSLWKAYKDIFWHLRVLADISSRNRKRGYPYWSFRKGFNEWRAYQQYNRKLSHT